MKKLFVLFGITLLVAVVAAPAMAADWKFYGSSRVSGWSIDNTNGAGTSVRNTRFQLQNNSRLGARVSGGKIYGRFEFGLNPDGDTTAPVVGANAQTSTGDAGPYIRLFFGVWDFGAGKLLVGQDYTPEYLGTSNANMAGGSDSVMLGRGTPYTGRRAQLRLEFGEFHIALVDSTASGALGTGGTTEITIPKLAAKYTMKFDPVTFDIAGSYLSYDIKPAAAGPDFNIDAYYIGGRGTVNVGPATIKAVLYYAQNGNELAFSSLPADGAIIAGASVIDNDTLGFTITVGYKLSDMIQFEAGYGRQQSEQDDAGVGSKSGVLTEDDHVAYYIQSTITMAKGVYIVPEWGIDDYKSGPNGADQGKNTWFGAKFQIDF
jgi:hypothetical protein